MGETRRESLSLNQLNYSAVTGSSTDKWTELQYAYVGGWFATLPLWVAIGLSLGGHRPFPFLLWFVWVDVSLSLGWPSAFPLVFVPYRDLIRFWGANFAHPLIYISPTIYHSDHI